MEATGHNNTPLSPSQDISGNQAPIRKILDQFRRNRNLQDVAFFDQLAKPFKQHLKTELDKLTIFEKHLVSEKLVKWRKEQTRLSLYGFHKCMNDKIRALSVSLDNLQIEFEKLAVYISKVRSELKTTEEIIEHEIQSFGDLHAFAAASNATKQLKYFVQKAREDLKKLWEDLINNCMLVETQPPPIYEYNKKKFAIDVKIRFLFGNLLYTQITSGRLNILSRILVEEKPNVWLAMDMNGENVGEIIGKNEILEEIIRDQKKRITFNFKNVQLKIFSRDGKGNKGKVGTTGSAPDERVMEKKMFLEFECLDKKEPPSFQVSTISLPFVVTSHWTQEWQADASITWDHAFRSAEGVPKMVNWALVAELLKMKCLVMTAQDDKNRELTEDNIAFLKKKAFSIKRENNLTETISLVELSKEKLTQPTIRDFTFWQWFHGALKLISREETHLKGLWNKGLIIGFIERETAERLLCECLVGTFLLRFADSCVGIITIAVHYEQGLVRHSERFDFSDLKKKNISMYIKDQGCLKYLYQPNNVHPSTKDEVFKEFYDAPQTGIISPYTGLSSGPSIVQPLEFPPIERFSSQERHFTQVQNNSSSSAVPMATDPIYSQFPNVMPTEINNSQMAFSNPLWSNISMDAIAAYGSTSTGTNFLQQGQSQPQERSAQVPGPFNDLLLLNENIAPGHSQTMMNETSDSSAFPLLRQISDLMDFHEGNTGDTDMGE